jgi:hypothetical protein
MEGQGRGEAQGVADPKKQKKQYILSHFIHNSTAMFP